jgi:hypothetical protein
MTKAEFEIIRDIESAARDRQKISAASVKAWLDHPSLEVLGAVNVHIMQNTRLVEPPLSMEEICSTVQEYYRQCLIQNLQTSQYAPNRSIAGLELVGWFQSLWRDPAVPREYALRLKVMLRDLCLEGKVPQDQIAGAVLEHLFETPQIAEFFSDWGSDTRLKGAFELAMEWAQDHRPPNLPQA